MQLCFFGKTTAKVAGACSLTDTTTIKPACCVGTETDEDHSFTCDIFAFQLKTGHESRGRTLPGLLGTLWHAVISANLATAKDCTC